MRRYRGILGNGDKFLYAEEIGDKFLYADCVCETRQIHLENIGMERKIYLEPSEN